MQSEHYSTNEAPGTVTRAYILTNINNRFILHYMYICVDKGIGNFLAQLFIDNRKSVNLHTSGPHLRFLAIISYILGKQWMSPPPKYYPL